MTKVIKPKGIVWVVIPMANDTLWGEVRVFTKKIWAETYAKQQEHKEGEGVKFVVKKEFVQDTYEYIVECPNNKDYIDR